MSKTNELFMKHTQYYTTTMRTNIYDTYILDFTCAQTLT